MAKLVYLFAVVALAQIAYSLDCYTCDAVTCLLEQSKWQKVVNCGKTVDNEKNTGACLKQTYIDKISNKDVTLRKCVIADKDKSGKVSHRCNENDGKVTICEVCTSDYCNSAPAVKFSFVTLLGVLAAYLIPKYL